MFYDRERTRERAAEDGGPSASSSRSRNRETEEEEEARPSTSAAGGRDEDGEKSKGKDEEGKEEAVEAVLTEEDLIQQSQADYDSGRYSPALLTSSELPLDSHTITPEEDAHRLQLARRQLQVTGTRLRAHNSHFIQVAKLMLTKKEL